MSNSKKYKFDDFTSFYVSTSQRYCQSDYDSILQYESNKSVKLWAWKNDKATAEIAILCAEKELEDVTVSASQLTSQNASIPKSAVKLSFVREVRAYTGHAGWYANNPKNIMPRGKREYYPEVIYSDEPVTIEGGKLRLVWLEISVDKDTAGGNYRGEISVFAKNSSKKQVLDIELEVQELTLPDCSRYLFDTEYWSYPYNIAYYYDVSPFSQEHIEILKQHMTLYKSLGGHAVTASIVEEAWGGQTYGGGRKIHYPSMIKWIKNADGRWSFDYTVFDKWVKLNKSIGTADKIICYTMMPWGNIIRYYDERSKKEKKLRLNPANKSECKKVWLLFLQSFVSHLDLNGWFESTYIGFDERHHMENILDIIDLVKNKDNLTLKKSAAFNDFKNNSAVFDRLDCASVGLDQVRLYPEEFKNQVAKRRQSNKQTTVYTATEHIPNSFTKSFPVESYWSIMYTASFNATGFLRWAYDAWVENPLEDSTHWSFPAGDCFLVYPSQKGQGTPESKFSIRLAKLDEGVRDANKLFLMRENSPQLAEKIDLIFSEISENTQDTYEYYTMQKTNIWGRKAKWLTEAGRDKLIDDMQKLKNSIYELSKIYCDIQNKNSDND